VSGSERELGKEDAGSGKTGENTKYCVIFPIKIVQRGRSHPLMGVYVKQERACGVFLGGNARF